MKEAAADPHVAFPRPLAGKIVAIVHPAWHSCGSHGVFAAQAQAYKRLGAQTVSIAAADTPGCVEGTKCAAAYFAAASDIDADIRTFAGMPLREVLNSGFLRASIEWLHGNQALMRLEVARRTPVPELRPRAPHADLIHCNHFFTVPIAARLRGRYGCPVMLETHDLQARQYALHAPLGVKLPPAASYEDMLATECDVMRQADILVHLNAEEAQEFRRLLPGKRHALIYPAAGPMPAGAGGAEAILVAAANYPNFLGVRWFLKEVLPLAPQARVRIYGGIAQFMRWRAPLLFTKHAGLFQGRVDGSILRGAYRNASAVLLPAVAGHGISIKTIEALSCGAPLIATKLAFRGFPPGATELANVTIAEDAACFAAALARAHERRHLPGASRASSPARRFYEQHFAFDTYCQSLFAAAGAVMQSGPRELSPFTSP
ncbi:MAG: glycosyltransferase [Methylocapsa sp.]|nr:glycosyltransferase [Methylocapsa sp.]